MTRPLTQAVFVYCLPPIDFWPAWLDPKAVVADFATYDAPDRIDREAYEDFMIEAQRLARALNWEGDFSTGPLVAAVPCLDGGWFTFMIGWKQANNGTTYIASPVPLPHLDAACWTKATGQIVRGGRDQMTLQDVSRRMTAQRSASSNPTVPGHGFAKGPSRRIVVSFDQETFAQIRQRAIADGQSFGASVRELVEWGLMADWEDA